MANERKKAAPLYASEADCCGCGACAAVCAHSAIEMKYGSRGFLYPEINGDKCTGCGACLRVCIQKNKDQ